MKYYIKTICTKTYLFVQQHYLVTVMISSLIHLNKRKKITRCFKVSSPTNGCSLELCIPFPLLLRTNNMHVTVSSFTNHISRYICRQRSRFPRNGSLLLIGQFKERNAELESAAVSWGGALRDDPNNGCEGDYNNP